MSNGTRIGALLTVLLAAAGLLSVLLLPGRVYTLHARFLNAGGLVSGGRVEVAGRPVGTIGTIALTPDGQANVALTISDRAITPMHVGTRAAIRAVGQAGVTSNYVDLQPGSATGAELTSGSVLSTAQTSGIVPIDALLDSFGPAQRTNLDELISSSAQIYAGSGSRYFNGMLGKLDPALGELDRLTGNLALDRDTLGQLVRAGSAAASAAASRHTDLTQEVTYTAHALAAIAQQRAALGDDISRAAPVLRLAGTTLARVRVAVGALRPTLRAAAPAAAPLNAYLKRLDGVLPQASPVAAELTSELPDLNRSLAGIQPIATPLVSTLHSLGPAMKQLFPIAQGLRYYGTDIVLGTLASLFGTISPEYDAEGHYAKVNFVQSAQTLIEGPLSAALSAHPLVPGLLAIRTHLLRRCPGGNQPPAPDGSSPWDLGPQLCTAADDEPLSVDFP